MIRRARCSPRDHDTGPSSRGALEGNVGDRQAFASPASNPAGRTSCADTGRRAAGRTRRCNSPGPLRQEDRQDGRPRSESQARRCTREHEQRRPSSSRSRGREHVQTPKVRMERCGRRRRGPMPRRCVTSSWAHERVLDSPLQRSQLTVSETTSKNIER